MRPELPTAVAVDNSASIQPARSIFISWGKFVQISGATSAAVAHGAQCLKQSLDPSALTLVAVAVRLEPGDKLLLERIEHAGRGLPHRILGSTISGSLSHLVAVFLDIPSRRLAWRTDMPSRNTRRSNLLKVPTLITPGHPCLKNKQDRPMKWLKFGCKFPSKWLSFY